jgi:hypothetical protein
MFSNLSSFWGGYISGATPERTFLYQGKPITSIQNGSTLTQQPGCTAKDSDVCFGSMRFISSGPSGRIRYSAGNLAETGKPNKGMTK